MQLHAPRRPQVKLGPVHSSSILAPLATWLAILALWTPRGVARAAAASADERYILGTFIYGPNNQLLALKESLVLARLTNRTLVIPPLATHLLDTPDGHLQVIPITSVVDWHALRKFARIKLWSELLDSGVWDGSVDVMVHGTKWDAFWTDDALKLLGSVYPKLNTEAARRHTILKWWNCTNVEQAQIERYLSASSPPSLPLASVFQRIVPAARNATTYRFNGTTPCMTLYNQVCAYTIKAPTIQHLATAWIAQKLGGSKHFVLMHVRPYPDSCLYAWTNTSVAMTMDNMVFWNCTMPTLWHSMGPVASQILLRLPTWHHLVVMAHPSIRPRVTSGLAMYGLVPRFVDVDIISGVFSEEYSGTAVSFVEQEIAVRSAVFVGSDASSMTVNAMHERTARGVPVGRTTTFELVEAATGLAAKITRAVNETGRPLEMDDVPISAALSGIDTPWNGQLFDPLATPGLVDRPWELFGRRS